MTRMVHPSLPGAEFTAVDPAQADTLRKSGWKSASAVKAVRTRKRTERAAKKSAPRAVTTEAGGTSPADTEKE